MQVRLLLLVWVAGPWPAGCERKRAVCSIQHPCERGGWPLPVAQPPRVPGLGVAPWRRRRPMDPAAGRAPSGTGGVLRRVVWRAPAGGRGRSSRIRRRLPGGRQASVTLPLSMGVPWSCVPSVAARRFDLLEGLDVDVGDDPQTFSIGRVDQGFGKRVEAVTPVLLQPDEFGHGVAPALRARASVTGLSGVDGGMPALRRSRYRRCFSAGVRAMMDLPVMPCCRGAVACCACVGIRP